MLAFLITLSLTLGVSFLCSLMEAMVLSTTVSETESLKKRRPAAGQHLEDLRLSLDETIATILTLNTLANSIGSLALGRIAAGLFSGWTFTLVSGAIFLAILLISEALPKNIGVIHRRALQPAIATPLWFARRALTPINVVCSAVVRFFIRRPPENQDSDEEIILLAERGAKEGTLTRSESQIIANALSLDETRVSEIMTPRIVVTALRKAATVGEIFREYPAGLPHARMPVHGKGLDDITGLVRRRDLLRAKANDQDLELVEKLQQEVHFIPETATAAQALQQFLKTHQQLLVVVDEFGATAGVVTMEDVMEHLLGREIFEKDDVAVDMREFARSKMLRQAVPRRATTSTAVPWSSRPAPSSTTTPPPAPPAA